MKPDFQIRQFEAADLDAVYRLVQDTIDTTYPEVYSPEAVQFFKEHHSRQTILSDASTGYTLVAEKNSRILGTGTLLETNIRRVYIDFQQQHQGIGKAIVQLLLQ